MIDWLLSRGQELVDDKENNDQNSLMGDQGIKKRSFRSISQGVVNQGSGKAPISGQSPKNSQNSQNSQNSFNPLNAQNSQGSQSLAFQQQQKLEKLYNILKFLGRHIQSYNKELIGSLEGQIFQYRGIGKFRKYLDRLKHINCRNSERNEMIASLCRLWHRTVAIEKRLLNNKQLLIVQQDLEQLEIDDLMFSRVINLNVPYDESTIFVNNYQRSRRFRMLLNTDKIRFVQGVVPSTIFVSEYHLNHPQMTLLSGFDEEIQQNVLIRKFDLPEGDPKNNAREFLRTSPLSIPFQLQDKIPGIARIYETVYLTQSSVFEDSIYKNHLFILQETGVISYQQIIERNIRLTEKEMLELVRSVLKTLQKLHSSDIAHRNVIPENIHYFEKKQSRDDLRDEGEERGSGGWKLCGFDYATECLSSSKKVTKYDIVGAPFYMSPQVSELYCSEKSQGEYDPRSQDLYSFGVCLVWFSNFNARKSIQEYITEIANKKERSLLEEVQLRLLSRAPADRLKCYDLEGLFENNAEVQRPHFMKQRKLKAEVPDFENDVELSLQIARSNELLGRSELQCQFLENALGNLQDHTEQYQWLWSITYEMSELWLQQKRLDQCFETALRGLEFLRKDFSDSLAYTYNIRLIAKCLSAQHRDYSKAVSYLQESLQMRSRILGQKNRLVGEIYFDLGLLHQQHEKHAPASQSYTQALYIHQFNFGFESTHLIKIFYKLIQNSIAQKNLESAQQFNIRIQQIIDSQGEGLNQEKAFCYSLQGLIEEKKNQFSKSLESYNRAADIQHAIYGEKNIQYTKYMISYIFVLMFLKKYTEAIKEYEKIKRIYSEIFGDNHTETAIIIFNQSYAYEAVKNYDLAIKNCQKSIDIISNIDSERAKRWNERLTKLQSKTQE